MANTFNFISVLTGNWYGQTPPHKALFPVVVVRAITLVVSTSNYSPIWGEVESQQFWTSTGEGFSLHFVVTSGGTGPNWPYCHNESFLTRKLWGSQKRPTKRIVINLIRFFKPSVRKSLRMNWGCTVIGNNDTSFALMLGWKYGFSRGTRLGVCFSVCCIERWSGWQPRWWQ